MEYLSFYKHDSNEIPLAIYFEDGQLNGTIKENVVRRKRKCKIQDDRR